MTTFSGASTPRFDGTFDMGFGTPDLFSMNDKNDYFSSAPKMQSDYGFPGLFTPTPYPNRMDITPPHSATDPPSNWPYGADTTNQPTENTFNKQSIPEIKLTATAKFQHGQTTPPDEANRAPDLDDLHASSFKPVKRESTSTMKPTKTSKRSKKVKENSVEELDKRSKFLERNRVAASKCRQKKKEYNGQLEQKAKLLERDNAFLKMELEKYQTEKIALMTAMASHTPDSCDCEQIHQHLASFKAQFSEPTAASVEDRRRSVSSTTSTLPIESA